MSANDYYSAGKPQDQQYGQQQQGQYYPPPGESRSVIPKELQKGGINWDGIYALSDLWLRRMKLEIMVHWPYKPWLIPSDDAMSPKHSCRTKLCHVSVH